MNVVFSPCSETVLNRTHVKVTSQMSIPESLQKKLREGLVVPFVGAGVSMSVLDWVSAKPVFPTWRRLLLESADRLERETKQAEAELVRRLLKVSPPDFLQAAIEHELHQELFGMSSSDGII